MNTSNQQSRGGDQQIRLGKRKQAEDRIQQETESPGRQGHSNS